MCVRPTSAESCSKFFSQKKVTWCIQVFSACNFMGSNIFGKIQILHEKMFLFLKFRQIFKNNPMVPKSQLCCVVQTSTGWLGGSPNVQRPSRP
jgi:hypothetical protein